MGQNKFSKRIRSYLQLQDGNFAMMFSLAILPVSLVIGLAFDYSRIVTAERELQSALDSAALTAGRDINLTELEIKQKAQAFIQLHLPQARFTQTVNLTVTKVNDEVNIKASTAIEATFMQLAGFGTLAILGETEVARGGLTEVALVLDNTGSMNPYINQLKTGSSDLLDQLFGPNATSPNVSVAIIPYVGTVNIGNSGAHMSWMDTNGDAAKHGINFEGRKMGEDSCPPPPPSTSSSSTSSTSSSSSSSGGPPPVPGGGSDLGAVDPFYQQAAEQMFASAGAALREVAGIKEARAAGYVSPPPALEFVQSGCKYYTPSKVNHFDLFDQIPNAGWKGCVEARPSPLDVQDTAPTIVDPNTLWVPYFWPDEVDGDTDFRNFYLEDNLRLDTTIFWQGDSQHQYNTEKYNGTPGTIDEFSFIGSGPNLACPTPLTPLTNQRNILDAAVAAMRPWGGSGTNPATGLVWAWRALSPTPPFTEGEPYENTDNRKFIVLMSDGLNAVVEQATLNKSDYTAYNYLDRGVLGQPETAWQYYLGLNDRMAQVCQNIKDKEIIIFSILFNVDNDTSENLYRSCATSPEFFYEPDTGASLAQTFDLIGAQIVALRLTK